MKEKLEELRRKLQEVSLLALELHAGGVTLHVTVGSEQKVITVKSSKILSFEVEGEINQKL